MLVISVVECGDHIGYCRAEEPGSKTQSSSRTLPGLYTGRSTHTTSISLDKFKSGPPRTRMLLLFEGGGHESLDADLSVLPAKLVRFLELDFRRAFVLEALVFGYDRFF